MHLPYTVYSIAFDLLPMIFRRIVDNNVSGRKSYLARRRVNLKKTDSRINARIERGEAVGVMSSFA